jgi:hypothetical protein
VVADREDVGHGGEVEGLEGEMGLSGVAQGAGVDHGGADECAVIQKEHGVAGGEYFQAVQGLADGAEVRSGRTGGGPATEAEVVDVADRAGTGAGANQGVIWRLCII